MKIEQQTFTLDGRWLPGVATDVSVQDVLWSYGAPRPFAEKREGSPAIMLSRLPLLDWPSNLFA
jgi:hypothetical protein